MTGEIWMRWAKYDISGVVRRIDGWGVDLPSPLYPTYIYFYGTCEAHNQDPKSYFESLTLSRRVWALTTKESASRFTKLRKAKNLCIKFFLKSLF